MRSRYVAFVLKNENYLKQTWVESECPQNLGLDQSVKWLRLQIIDSKDSFQNDSKSQVEFKAWFIENEKLFCLHEISDFEKQNGQWLYHSGKILEEPAEAISRNQTCPCGSGKKFKRCCLRNDNN